MWSQLLAVSHRGGLGRWCRDPQAPLAPGVLPRSLDSALLRLPARIPHGRLGWCVLTTRDAAVREPTGALRREPGKGRQLLPGHSLYR